VGKSKGELTVSVLVSPSVCSLSSSCGFRSLSTPPASAVLMLGIWCSCSMGATS